MYLIKGTVVVFCYLPLYNEAIRKVSANYWGLFCCVLYMLGIIGLKTEIAGNSFPLKI